MPIRETEGRLRVAVHVAMGSFYPDFAVRWPACVTIPAACARDIQKTTALGGVAMTIALIVEAAHEKRN